MQTPQAAGPPAVTWRLVGFWLLLALALASAGLIAALIAWGGRIEVSLLVFGEPVQLVVDAARWRIWLLGLLPLLLVAAALGLRARSADS